MLALQKKFKTEDLVHTVGNPYTNKLYSTLYFFKVVLSAVGASVGASWKESIFYQFFPSSKTEWAKKKKNSWANLKWFK